MEDAWRTVPEFPQLRELVIEDKLLFDDAFSQFPPSISEFTFTNLFIWRHAYQIKFYRYETFLCLLSDKEDAPFFFPPVGEGDRMKCCRALLESFGQRGRPRGRPPKIARVPEEQIRSFDWKGAGLVAELDLAQSDYVYLTSDLIQLGGRKYHRKRNHIKQFKEKYSYQYVSLQSQWVPECLRLQTEWCDLRQCDVIPGLSNEFAAIKEALSHFETLGLRGGAILIDGKVEAFTLGEPLNRETVVIHVEKANPAFEGLYTVMNQTFLEHQWSEYRYVNREQDLGEEGLRKAKESYFPHHRVHKYTVTLG